MKAKEAKWLNIIALVLLYAITAVVACLLVHICDKYVFAIAENIRNYAYIGVSVVTFMVLIFRFVKLPLKKLAKFEWVTAIIFTLAALLLYAIGLVAVARTYGVNRGVIVEYLYIGYYSFALLIPIILAVLSCFLCARYLLEITERAFWIYTSAALIVAPLYATDYLLDPCTLATLVLISVSLILMCIFCSKALQMVKNRAKVADVASFQGKMWLVCFTSTIVMLFITCFIISIFDFFGIILSIAMYGFIMLAVIPCALYLGLIKLACFKYKREEEGN